ncbi:MAG TPA: hypothetical protein VI365_30175 [Trebonia sp.]
MAGAAVRESATFAGRPDQVREARAFVARPTRTVTVTSRFSWPAGDQQPAAQRLAAPGEAVTVTVVVRDASVRVEVTVGKAGGVPVLHPSDDEAEGQLGPRLVEDLAVRWGYERGGGQATTWFEGAVRHLFQALRCAHTTRCW